jgi:hypothetical protein
MGRKKRRSKCRRCLKLELAQPTHRRSPSLRQTATRRSSADDRQPTLKDRSWPRAPVQRTSCRSWRGSLPPRRGPRRRLAGPRRARAAILCESARRAASFASAASRTAKVTSQEDLIQMSDSNEAFVAKAFFQDRSRSDWPCNKHQRGSGAEFGALELNRVGK